MLMIVVVTFNNCNVDSNSGGNVDDVRNDGGDSGVDDDDDDVNDVDDGDAFGDDFVVGGVGRDNKFCQNSRRVSK